MSGDDYFWVRKRADGRYGVSRRNVLNLYEDEGPWGDLPFLLITAEPEDVAVYDSPIEAVVSAHALCAKEAVPRCGVRVSTDSLAAVEARMPW